MAAKSKKKKNKPVSKPKTIKIGITLGLKDNKESIWTNGIKQNVLMMIHMLKNSEKNYEVHLLNTLKADFSTKPSYLNDIDVSYFEDKYLEMDLLVVMGAQIHNHQIDKKKDKLKNIEGSFIWLYAHAKTEQEKQFLINQFAEKHGSKI